MDCTAGARQYANTRAVIGGGAAATGAATCLAFSWAFSSAPALMSVSCVDLSEEKGGFSPFVLENPKRLPSQLFDGLGDGAEAADVDAGAGASCGFT